MLEEIKQSGRILNEGEGRTVNRWVLSNIITKRIFIVNNTLI